MIRRGEYVAFCGPLGSGKTLNMTRVAAMDAIGGRKVYANYPTAFAQSIDSIPHLFSIRDALICLDELQATMDSREFKKAGDLAQWILIVRKLGCSVLYTTQSFGFVDLRVRQITTYVYQCEPASWQGNNATKVELYGVRGEAGRLIRKFIMPHSPMLYALYDSFDINVKLTETGKESSFQHTPVASAAEPLSVASVRSSSLHTSSSGPFVGRRSVS